MKLLLGNEAIARGAWEAGVRVATAYPGTPSTEITEAITVYPEVYCEWSPNEKVALEVAIGASMGGARTLCSMKHVGVNVAADPLFTVSYSGINGGLVLVCADDPGMHSSQNEQDSRFYARSAHIPMLEPSDSSECISMMKSAFEISEFYDTPVMMRVMTRVAHSRSMAVTGERADVPLREYVKDPGKYVMMPGFARGRHVVVENRENKLRSEIGNWNLNRIEWADRKVGVICSGPVYNYVKDALPEVSILKLGMVYPLDESLIREFAAQVETLYVIEELEPFFEDAIRAMGIAVSGKDKTGLQGELFVRQIQHRFAGQENPGPQLTPGIPNRPPVLCPGCPHRAIFYTLSRMGLTVIGDIGCYTLGALPPLQAMDSEICMGASIGMAAGFEKARGADVARKTVAVIGDSTFVHSGITGLINVVYNQSHTTVLILDNSTTGMTGHQPNPATGKTIRGEITTVLDLEKLCEAIGVPSIRVVDPHDMSALKKTISEELQKDCPSVVIIRRPCALLKREKEAVYTVLPDSCIGCYACMRLGCPAIEKSNGKVRINEALCVGCGQCESVCPTKAIVRKEDL